MLIRDGILATLVLLVYPFIYLMGHDDNGKIRKWIGKYWVFMRMLND